MKLVSMKLVSTILIALIVMLFGSGAPSGARAASAVNLGNADSFAVLAGTAVTNVPTSVITGDVGLSPAAGTNYAGLTSGEVSGTIYAVDATGPDGAAGNNPGVVNSAKDDLVTAYLNAAAQTPTTTYVGTDNQLGGKTLTPGVYAFGHGDTANLTGTMTLDGQADPNAVFIFQASSDLVTASSSVVTLVNGAQACNVFWQVTSSATLGTSSTFVGTIMALTAISVNTSATIAGRALARNAAVTLQQNTITKPTCDAAAAAAAIAAAAAAAATPTPSPSASSTATPAATAAPTLPNSGFGPSTQTIPWQLPVGLAIFLFVGTVSYRKQRFARR